MSNLNHPLVAGAGGASKFLGKIAGKIKDGLGSFITDAASSAAGNLAVTAVENTFSDSGDGVKGFRPAAGDDKPLTNISSQSTQALASSLRIEPILDPRTSTLEDIQSQSERLKSGDGVLNEMNTRITNDESQGEILDSTLAKKNEMDAQSAGEFLSGVSNAGINALDSLGLIPDVLSDTLRNLVNGATGGKGKRDSRYVSREYHEFAYCRSSDSTGTSAITNVLRFMIHWDNKGANVPGTNIADLIYHPSAGQRLLDQGLFNEIDNRSISYGQFVDMYCLREFIALFRKIRRKVFAANVKCAFELVDPPIDQGLLMAQVIAQLDFTPLILEFNRTFNNGVAFGTNRRFKENGRIDDGGQGLTNNGSTGESPGGGSDDVIADAISNPDIDTNAPRNTLAFVEDLVQRAYFPMQVQDFLNDVLDVTPFDEIAFQAAIGMVAQLNSITVAESPSGLPDGERAFTVQDAVDAWAATS